MRWMSILHEQLVVLVAAGLVALFLGTRHDWRSARALLVVPAGMLLNVGVKHVFHRARPHWDDALVQLTTYSFPSGHAVASTVFWGMCCALVFAHTRSLLWRAIAVLVAAVMIVLVCFSRVYLGAHYPSDVTAGVALGLSCVLAFVPLLRR
jgi:undecaprenyl-diphosphatase